MLSVFEASLRFSKLWCAWTRGTVAFGCDSWPSSQVTPSIRTFTRNDKKTLSTRKRQHCFFFCKMIIISFYVRIFLIKWPFVGWCGQFGIWTNFNIKESGLASIVTTRPNSNHTGVWPTFLSHLSHLQHWQHCIISLRAYTRIRPFLLSICTFLYPITPLDFRQDPAAAKIEFSHPARYWPRLITLSHMLINCFQVKKWLAAILKLFRRWVKVAVSSWSRCFCVVFEGQQKLVNLSATAEPVFWKLWQMAVKNVFNFFAPARWRLVQPS